MPSDELKKLNDINGLEPCPRGTDVGAFGRATKTVDNFVAGFIYAAAIEELIQRTKEIELALATLTEEEREELLPTLKEDLADIDAKWVIATALFGVDA